MNLRCPHCGSELLLDVEVCPGQNIACPYCAKKFAYRDEALGGPVKMKLLRRGPGAANRGFKSFLRTRGVVCGGVGAGVLALVLLSWLLLADGEYDFSTRAVNQNECPIVNFMEFHLDDVQVGTAYLYETDRKTLLVDEVVQGRG